MGGRGGGRGGGRQRYGGPGRQRDDMRGGMRQDVSKKCVLHVLCMHKCSSLQILCCRIPFQCNLPIAYERVLSMAWYKLVLYFEIKYFLSKG
jgi:hypothetical protein